MKVLRANIYYLLPDDFEGSFDEALELWRAYKNEADAPFDPINASYSVSHEALFCNERYGFKTTAEIGVWSLSNRSWHRLDKAPRHGFCRGAIFIK